MAKRATAGMGEGAAAEAPAAKATTKDVAVSKGKITQAVIRHPEPPVVKASAQEMAAHLEHYADELRRVAGQLRANKKGGTVALPWPPIGVILNCNGGGDGGNGGE